MVAVAIVTGIQRVSALPLGRKVFLLHLSGAPGCGLLILRICDMVTSCNVSWSSSFTLLSILYNPSEPGSCKSTMCLIGLCHIRSPGLMVATLQGPMMHRPFRRHATTFSFSLDNTLKQRGQALTRHRMRVAASKLIGPSRLGPQMWSRSLATVRQTPTIPDRP